MPRTYGARDRYPRKPRSDRGKKRKKYAGKKVKTKRQIKFEKRKGKKTHIKMYVFREEMMSKDGLKHWHPNVRHKIRNKVYYPDGVVVTPVADIPNRQAIEEWALVALGKPGFFKIGTWSGGRTKTGVKRVKAFDVLITETGDGLKATITRDWRLFRYKWFYKE